MDELWSEQGHDMLLQWIAALLFLASRDSLFGYFSPAWELNTVKLLLEDGWIYNRPTAFSTMCSSSDHSILCTLMV